MVGARQYGELVAGFYRTRLVRGGLYVGVRIWFGAPRWDDGEEMDRSPRWCVEVDGRTTRIERDEDGEVIGRCLLDPFEVWPFTEAITQREFEFLDRRRRWAIEHAPEHPAARPREKIDIRQLKPGS